MEHSLTPNGITVSFERYGRGRPLVLVHGGFSDHLTNWQESKSLLAEQFSVFAVARRGRGETSTTQGHSIGDEAADVACVLQSIDASPFLLGHSYGAVCALEAAMLSTDRVRKLVLYEHPGPGMMNAEIIKHLEQLGERGDWNAMVQTFMTDVLQIPLSEVDEIRTTPFWDVWLADAPATLNDLHALTKHTFDATRYAGLDVPVLLLIGTESPRDAYFTDALAGVLPNARIHALEGQAHEGMTTNPEQFVGAISNFLLND
jgi:pimeloyl-ACP methyl ester carboxylesterase